MAKFRKKPEFVEAVQFTQAVREAFHFDGGKLPDGVQSRGCELHPPTRVIHRDRFWMKSPVGELAVIVGDWIVTHANGDRWVCGNEAFREDYFPVKDSDDDPDRCTTTGRWRSVKIRALREKLRCL